MELKIETLWEKFSARLHKFISGKINDEFTADDLLQEVFIKIHSKIDQLEDHQKIESWIFQIARNTIIDHYRSSKKVIPPDIEESEDTFLEKENREMLMTVGIEEFVNKLPPKYKEAVVLTEYEGLSQKDLAERLGISYSGAKSRVQRGRQMIKDMLMRCCHFDFDKYGKLIDYHPITCCCCSEHSQ